MNIVKNVGAKKLYGTIFHASPEWVKHMDVLNNSFAHGATQIDGRANEFAPT